MGNTTVVEKSGGIGFFGLLTIVFVALKLTGYIGWSWWWVLAPLWAPALLVLVGIIIFWVFAYAITR
ncbi:hypothetical protein ACFQH5_20485 [Halomonas salifodinae]|uniref:Transmembrane Fragile-X-F protein n=1 Tax=Halomonas salifodinae TaxID=438745 RepID=A0ABW2F109_9GAMM